MEQDPKQDLTAADRGISPAEATAYNTPAGEDRSTALKVWRILFLLPMLVLGGYLALQLGLWMVRHVVMYRDAFGTGSAEVFGLVGFVAAGALATYLIALSAFNKLVQTGERLQVMDPNEKIATFLGIALGLLLTFLLSPILLRFASIGIMLTVLICVAFVYLGVVAMTSMKDEIRLSLPSSAAVAGKNGEPASLPERCKILDTNVIIDGRVADICRTGFLEGPIYVPGFVLDELQHIADSADGLKRARGRRGLDILNQMRAELPLSVRTYDNNDPNDRDEVDAKLVKLAKKLDGFIVTNDYNLNKVAELQGVRVLNINELANAVKPVVLPGEEMVVQIIKEGKEINQGVAYLEDGTMIVVEGGRRHIGETLEVVTMSVLQTAAGKMIFAAIREDDDEEDETSDRNLRAYPRSGPRRKIQH